MAHVCRLLLLQMQGKEEVLIVCILFVYSLLSAQTYPSPFALSCFSSLHFVTLRSSHNSSSLHYFLPPSPALFRSLFTPLLPSTLLFTSAPPHPLLPSCCPSSPYLINLYSFPSYCKHSSVFMFLHLYLL